MATKNAGEVRVTLAALSTQFNKSLSVAIAQMKTLRSEANATNKAISQPINSPIPRQLKNLQGEFVKTGKTGQQAFRRTGQAAQSSSRRINQANKSVTLLVAKFALLVFAVQTVANILNNTFGAALRNIDDFEQGVIGTAAAITNLADLENNPGSSFGQAFAQNLEFVRGAFAELEVIAGDFFSTANDLQLAFNTLAARGVVVRREEFNLLGLITDQIKLQTRGQASSIQIAQEIRNLFTGQVRAADQLAQLIKAQGGNVKEISKELRETGSLEPLAPFVAGLREAQSLFRGLLTPQLARFQALVSQISRFAFGDIFRDTVGLLNTINDLLTENRGEIVGIANLVTNRLFRAFQQVLTAVSGFGRIILDLATNAVPVLAIAIRTLFRSLGIIPQILIFITTLIIQQTAGVEGLAQTWRLIGNILRAGVLVTLLVIEDVLKFIVQAPLNFQSNLISAEFTVLSFFKSILEAVNKTGLAFGGVEDAIQGINNKLFDLAKEQFDIELGLKDEDGITFLERLESANKALEQFNNTASNQLDDTKSGFEGVADAIGATQEELGRAIVAQTQAELRSNAQPFDTTSFPGDNEAGRTADLLRRILEAQRRLREAEAKRNLELDLQVIKARSNAIDLAVAEEITTERDAFEERRNLLVQETNLRLASIEEQTQALKDLAIAQRLRIQGDSSIEAAEKRQQIELLNAQTATKIVGLQAQRLRIEQKLTNTLSDQNAQLEQTRIETERILEQRQRDVNTAFVTTLDDRLAQLRDDQADQLRDLTSQPGVTDEQVRQEQIRQREESLVESISTSVNAILSAIDQAFNSLIDGIVQGSLDFKQVAQDIGTTLLKGGLQDLLDGLKQSISEGLKSIFTELTDEAAGQAAAALAVGIGLLLTVLSKIGNDGSFTPSGGAGGGSVVQGTQQVRGIVAGDTSIAIAEINTGLSEALIPTNNILSSIERNTRVLAELNLNIDGAALSQSIQDTITDIFNTALLQASP